MRACVVLYVCTVCVYLSVQWLIDVHSVVLALLDEHVSTLPDESCGRVGVDGAAQEHRLLLVVAATHVTDGLVNRQHWRVKVYKTQKKGTRVEDEKDEICVYAETWFLKRGASI